MQDEWRQAQRVVAVEVRQEDRVDLARVDANLAHVRKQRGSAIEQQAPVHHHSPVVASRRKRSAGSEEGELYAMVTDALRYTF
ncbi:MAG: hypothetical protein PVS2B1_08250 [Candidatus Dormibacteraceae bacterium]